jgi:hypothetical protein
MRVVEGKQEFRPLIVTLETEEEVRVLRQVLYMQLLDLSNYITDSSDRKKFLDLRKIMYHTLVGRIEFGREE